MSTEPTTFSSGKSVERLQEVTILFAGDSGDGMQLTGSQFSLASALAFNDLATLPDFPAEIRAPAGTTYGVSAFQLHFGSVNIRTPGDEVDLLVAMNAAALKVMLDRVRPGGTIIVNTNSFEQRDLDLAGYNTSPLRDRSLADYQVIEVELTRLTREALKDRGMDFNTIDRSKNMFALGLSLWLYSRPLEPVISWIEEKFASKPDVKQANIDVLKKGLHYGETTEDFTYRYEVSPAVQEPGTYRFVRGNQALALGLVAATVQSEVPLFYGSYPITPASDVLHELSRFKQFGVKTFQAEDEIAAVGAAIGACFGGALGVCATSGPGLALKTEAMGLAVVTELPLVVINIQRGGPSTGMPTKTEQADLLQSMYGRNGEAPLIIIAPSSPGDCFYMAYEACRLAVKYMTPVILLSDGYLASGSEPWMIPDISTLADFNVTFATKSGDEPFLPYQRDATTLARPWARPGTAGLEHRVGGLSKEHETGNVSYDPINNQLMVDLRAEKVARVAADIPPTRIHGDDSGTLLVIGWGSTQGSIDAAVERSRAAGRSVSAIHLRHLNPFPQDLAQIFSGFDRFLVPELNSGQLVRLLRDKFLLPMVGLNKVQGQPFTSREIVQKIEEMLA
ncbi:2-oxoacid:acceptor oxidoreductase subunit alpha [Bacteroidota bacterium]